MNEKLKMEVSTWTIVRFFLVAIGFYVLFLVKDIVAMFFIVLILAATFSPVVKSWQRYLGRVFSILALFLILFISVVAIFYIIIPPLVNQTAELANSIPAYLNTLNFDLLRQYQSEIKSSLQSVASNLGSLTANIYSVTSGIVSAIFAVIMILVLTFYILIDEESVKKYISSVFTLEHKENAILVINKIAAKVGSWFRGQIMLALSIFVVDFIGLSIIGVPYALILAIIAGLLEFIPTVGPFIAGILSTLIALTISPWKALFVIILFLAVQMLENMYLVPKIMQKAVGISPVVIILSLLVGAKIFGIVGAILSIPLAASLSVVVVEWPTISKIFSKNG